MSFVHVVIGEVVPKNLALDKADRLALLVAPVLLVFYRISAPFVFVVERTSAGLSRALGLKGHGGGGHSAEELKFILESSRREGHLETFEEDAIQKLLGLEGNLRARDHDAAHRHRLGVRRREPGRASPHHARTQVLAHSGLRRQARAHHRIRSLQGPGARLARTEERHRSPPACDSVSPAALPARGCWWCPKPSR